MVFFAVQKLIILIRSHLLTLFLFLLTLEADLRKHRYDLCQRVLAMFSSRNFVVSCLIFKFFSPFEFTFLCGVKCMF